MDGCFGREYWLHRNGDKLETERDERDERRTEHEAVELRLGPWRRPHVAARPFSRSENLFVLCAE